MRLCDCVQTLAQSPICLELEEEEKERECRKAKEREILYILQEQEAPWETPVRQERGGANARQGEGPGRALWKQNLKEKRKDIFLPSER